MNLLTEYRKRHRGDFIWAVEEGAVFYSLNNIPELVLLSSSHSRCLQTCSRCETHVSGVILELFKGEDLICHIHQPPDCNITRFMTNLGYTEHKPFIPKSEQEAEMWLWDYYLKLVGRISSGFDSLTRKKGLNNKERFCEQLLWMIDYSPHHFSTFYNKFYCNFLVGRKYLLMR